MSDSPCRAHRWGAWEWRRAYHDRYKKYINIQVRECKNCPAVQTESVPE